MAETSTPKGDARRREILAAALPLFLEHGVGGVKLEQIRKASAASTGSIYNLFGGKESIAAAVYAESLAGYQDEFLAALWEDEGAADGIRSVVRFHLGWCRSHPELARFLFTMDDPEVLAEARERLRQANQRFYSELGSWWRVHAHHGALRRVTPAQSYALWIGPAMELVRNWLTRGGDPPTDGDVEVLSAAAWRALGTEGDEGTRRPSSPPR
jgi:AcrR family transcriptional regulator